MGYHQQTFHLCEKTTEKKKISGLMPYQFQKGKPHKGWEQKALKQCQSKTTYLHLVKSNKENYLVLNLL